MRLFFCFFAALLCLPAAPLTAEQHQLQIDSFEKVWTTVRDKHWDPKMGGVDWQAVHDEFRPKIEKAETAEQARAVLNEMIGRLRLSHFAIFPDEVYDRMNSSGSDNTGSGTVGIDVLFVD